MKHWYGVIASVWLSVLLVWTGAGIGLLHCSHTGQTEALQLSAKACHKSCRHGKAPCMSVKVVKLSPMQQVARLIHSPAPLSTPLALFQQPLFNISPAPCLVSHPVAKGRAWHGPPRSWLSFIRILII